MNTQGVLSSGGRGHHLRSDVFASGAFPERPNFGFSPDRSLAYGQFSDGLISVCSTTTGKPVIPDFRGEGQSEIIRIAPGGRSMAIASILDGVIQLRNLTGENPGPGYGSSSAVRFTKSDSTRAERI